MRVSRFFAAAAIAGIPACSVSSQQNARPEAESAGGVIEFELTVAPDHAFQSALAALVNRGLPIDYASASERIVRTQPHSIGVAVTQYIATVHEKGSGSRITLRGIMSIETVGIVNEPITPAAHGVRAAPWQHFSELAQAIDGRRAVAMPAVDRKTP